MTLPSTTKQWTVTSTEKDFAGLEYGEAPVPKVGENEVLLKIHAASLNYRDLIIPKGLYPFPARMPVVPLSDGAGEVLEVGSKVTEWKKGDKVVTLFNQGHQYGPVTLAAAATGLGGVVDGTLRQYAVLPESGLARAPRNLSYAETSTLSCAGLTSWNALYGLRPLKAGQTVLVQGTGGVSIFALQLAKAGGATVIATTSSKEKAETLKALGADHVINYKEDKEWGTTARGLTGGEGVDLIIEVGGEGSMEQSLAAIKFEGIISVIGFLGGKKPTATLMETLSHICTVRGTYVGSKEQLNELVRALEASDIHPVVDKKQFTLEQAKDAYDFLWSQRHFGKVVINIA